MKTSEILMLAKNRIQDPKYWIQVELSRNSNGIACDPQISDAACWCSLGAIDSFSVERDFTLHSPYRFLDSALADFGCSYISVAKFNDTNPRRSDAIV